MDSMHSEILAYGLQAARDMHDWYSKREKALEVGNNPQAVSACERHINVCAQVIGAYAKLAGEFDKIKRVPR